MINEIDKDREASCSVLMNLLHKMDMDDNGKISFSELGNFLILGHCREISLQKYHRKKVLCKGDNSFFIDCKGLKWVLDDAFSFLGVTISERLSYYLWDKADTDGDHQVSYAEFFKMTRDYFC